jgi:hypothetical protein
MMVVCGKAQVNERHKMWDILKFIPSTNDYRLLCIGDFNKVMHWSKHEGVSEQSYNEMDAFQEVMDVCGMCDHRGQG